MGEYNSETRTGRFDGQFKYMASGLGCFGVGEQSLAQFEAEVKANNNLEILP
jgi:hypothetical protein